jgi:hypothetical protein
MPIARLNREKLQILAESRIAEAAVLLKSDHWTGAYYLTGLGVECALKACLAKGVLHGDFPDKSFINKAYTHKLEDLAKLDPEFWRDLDTGSKTNTLLAGNWSTVFEWDDEKRYELVERSEATSLYVSVTQADSGVLEWIRRRW